MAANNSQLQLQGENNSKGGGEMASARFNSTTQDTSSRESTQFR
ncbi:hypothetical protein COLO4_37793 [Corchorus olitorius]|uniref:Uncharacterized protein n=1 Tax=Corchorus olitorius TaxID=93759 RepID=A0A1R3FZC5_9ROSI|nr:hypothetical protein COLO4_37793 [Corchorus olitorius]